MATKFTHNRCLIGGRKNYRNEIRSSDPKIRSSVGDPRWNQEMRGNTDRVLTPVWSGWGGEELLNIFAAADLSLSLSAPNRVGER
ncbi:hypothetical protein GW17_00025636 [Ensete ventricosum]|nr:hypothetical protein GW17_00025636 [Ensete ventricosum]